MQATRSPRTSVYKNYLHKLKKNHFKKNRINLVENPVPSSLFENHKHHLCHIEGVIPVMVLHSFVLQMGKWGLFLTKGYIRRFFLPCSFSWLWVGICRGSCSRCWIWTPNLSQWTFEWSPKKCLFNYPLWVQRKI